jgi:hypothetical protein
MGEQRRLGKWQSTRIEAWCVRDDVARCVVRGIGSLTLESEIPRLHDFSGTLKQRQRPL